jgi:hypothetical protein
VQRGRRREYENGEGMSPGKKDGGTAHQGGRAPMRWRMGRRGNVSSRRRDSPASDQGRAHWRRLGGRGGEGH